MVWLLHRVHVCHANEFRNILRTAEDPTENTDVDDERFPRWRYGCTNNETVLIVFKDIIS